MFAEAATPPAHQYCSSLPVAAAMIVCRPYRQGKENALLAGGMRYLLPSSAPALLDYRQNAPKAPPIFRGAPGAVDGRDEWRGRRLEAELALPDILPRDAPEEWALRVLGCEQRSLWVSVGMEGESALAALLLVDALTGWALQVFGRMQRHHRVLAGAEVELALAALLLADMPAGWALQVPGWMQKHHRVLVGAEVEPALAALLLADPLAEWALQVLGRVQGRWEVLAGAYDELVLRSPPPEEAADELVLEYHVAEGKRTGRVYLCVAEWRSTLVKLDSDILQELCNLVSILPLF